MASASTVMANVSTVVTGVPMVMLGASADRNEAIPAEEQRLNSRVFREGLKRLGLTEILEQHIRAFPPADMVASLLMMRDVHLTASVDPGLAPELRRRAITRANDILVELLQQADDDPRQFEWRFELAHSLLYDEAEPFFTRIMYLGGSREDHTKLRELAGRSLAEVETLTAQLAAEYKRIDLMSAAEFDRLERSGFIEQVDRLVPQSDYLLLWALYYDALGRDDADPLRAERLARILKLFEANPALLTVPHATSRIRVQALLLVGMTYRLYNEHAAAREQLNRAVAVADRIDDPAEQQRVSWARRLAQIESIRNETDDGRFDQAFGALKRFRRTASDSDVAGGVIVVDALLERRIYRAAADTADEAGRVAEARSLRDRSWQSLSKIVELQRSRRDEVYSTLYSLIDHNADPDRLDPLEHVALVAGLLADAQAQGAKALPLLDRVVAVGERFLARPRGPGERLIPEVLFNLGVAEHRRGRTEAAARRFLEVARRYPKFESAPRASAIAVQLAAELHDAAHEGASPDGKYETLYREALGVLVDGFPETDEARYYRFFYAQLLDESGRYDEAASQYALVDPQHEHYLESVFRGMRCLASALLGMTDTVSVDALELQERVAAFLALRRDFVNLATGVLGSGQDEQRAARVTTMLATARVLEAEVLISKWVDRPVQALETLDRIEDAFPAEVQLAGRVWRVRLIAYEQLDRLDEAARALPLYLRADPQGAGATLQALYNSVAKDAETLLDGDQENQAKTKAATALLLAEQIDTWANQPVVAAGADLLRSVAVQLAEATLRAGRLERARALFESIVGKTDGNPIDPDALDPRIVLGYAESLYQLDNPAAALPLFNRLAVRLPSRDTRRWKALLRDLQCRTALGEPAEGIIRVIQQQQYLDADLGGPSLASRFHKLLRKNQRRREEE